LLLNIFFNSYAIDEKASVLTTGNFLALSNICGQGKEFTLRVEHQKCFSIAKKVDKSEQMI